jgi:hypothetical protein
MIDAILSTVGGILSYFLGSFGGAQLFDNPGLEADFGAWKVLFAFVAAGSVFLSQSGRGLLIVFIIGALSALGLGLNYKSSTAIPPIGSATETAWFSFQLAQACFVGIGVRLAAKLKDVLPKKEDGKGEAS